MDFLKKELMASGAAHAHDEEHPHVSPLGLYLGVFGVLLVLTIITVLVSVIGLPPTISVLVAMAVATVKASFVVLFFMHLKYDNKFYSFIFLSSLFFVGLFFTITLADMAFVDFLVPEQGPEAWREEQLLIKAEEARKAMDVGQPADAPASAPVIPSAESAPAVPATTPMDAGAPVDPAAAPVDPATSAPAETSPAP
jgi:cytochrome c oxidase subunit 4